MSVKTFVSGTGAHASGAGRNRALRLLALMLFSLAVACGGDDKPECGNGVEEMGEVCDDGNLDDGDGCNSTCTSKEICLNGIVDTAVGEECDDGAESAECNVDCTAAKCGDSKINTSAGENCDEGTQADSATCDSDCTEVLCGDGHANPQNNEECDDDGDSATCDADCTPVECGDTYVNTAAGEDCDLGAPQDFAECDSDCTAVVCGDGHVNSAAFPTAEQCDEGGDTATCDGNCTLAFCGDGYTNPAANEQCDDGNRTNNDGCDSNCQLE